MKTTNMYIARAMGELIPVVASSGLLAHQRDGLSIQVFDLMPNSPVALCAGIPSVGVSKTPSFKFWSQQIPSLWQSIKVKPS